MTFTRAEQFELMQIVDQYAEDCQERARHGNMPAAMRVEMRARAARADVLADRINQDLSGGLSS